MRHPNKTVVLLSPFWGGNLGDAAILKAIIENLRNHSPGIEITAVTMDPHSMLNTCGVAGTRLVGSPVKFFSYFPEQTQSGGLKASCRRLWRGVQRAVSRPFTEASHWIHALRFLRRTDLLLIAGGGQLDEEWGGPWGLPYAIFKWSVAARLTRTAVAFMSVGVCKLETSTGRWFYRQALALAKYVSMRDPWSQSFVANQLAKRTALLVPDAAFSLRLSQSHRERTTASYPAKIGISPIAYGRTNLWPTKSDAADRYLQVLIDFANARLLAGDSIVLFATDGPDWILVQEMIAALQQRAPQAAAERLRTQQTATADDALKVVSSLDVVVASRLHGVILSHLLHTPVIAISYDRKVSAHMQQMGQEHLCIDFSEVSHEALAEKLAISLSNREALASQLRAIATDWRERLDRQYETIVRLC
jgi:polysaccharide pyruvyl transferase WcaK-like protein